MGALLLLLSIAGGVLHASGPAEHGGLYNYDATLRTVLPMKLSAEQKKQMLEQGYLIFKNAIPKALVAEMASVVHSKVGAVTKEEMQRIAGNARPNAIDSAVLGRNAEADPVINVDWRQLEQDPAARLAGLSYGDRLFARLLMQGQGLSIAKALYGDAPLGKTAEPHIAYRYTAAKLAKIAGATYTKRDELEVVKDQMRQLLWGDNWHVDDFSNELGSFAFIMGHMLTASNTLFSGNFGVHPGGHLLFQDYLREFHRQGGSIDALVVAHAHHVQRSKTGKDVSPGERGDTVNMGPHQERFMGFLAATGRALAPLEHMLVEPGDIVVAHHLLPHDAVVDINKTPGTDRICVFYRFDHKTLRQNEGDKVDCAETDARWDSVTDAFSLGWKPLQSLRAGTKAAPRRSRAPPPPGVAEGGCTGRVISRDGKMEEGDEQAGRAAGRKTKPLSYVGTRATCSSQADCNGWQSPLLEQGYFFCADTGVCLRCEALRYVPGKAPPAAADGAKYAFNSLDGALPLMCPGLNFAYDRNRYGAAFSGILEAQQIASTQVLLANAAYKWANALLKGTPNQTSDPGLVEEAELAALALLAWVAAAVAWKAWRRSKQRQAEADVHRFA